MSEGPSIKPKISVGGKEEEMEIAPPQRIPYSKLAAVLATKSSKKPTSTPAPSVATKPEIKFKPWEPLSPTEQESLYKSLIPEFIFGSSENDSVTTSSSSGNGMSDASSKLATFLHGFKILHDYRHSKPQPLLSRTQLTFRSPHFHGDSFPSIMVNLDLALDSPIYENPLSKKQRVERNPLKPQIADFLKVSVNIPLSNTHSFAGNPRCADTMDRFIEVDQFPTLATGVGEC